MHIAHDEMVIKIKETKVVFICYFIYLEYFSLIYADVPFVFDRLKSSLACHEFK